MSVAYKSPPKSILTDWVDKCLITHDKYKNLTTWEFSFITSLKDQLKHKDTLSESQVRFLEGIYAGRTK